MACFFLFVNPYKIRKSENSLKKVIKKFGLYTIYGIYLCSDNSK